MNKQILFKIRIYILALVVGCYGQQSLAQSAKTALDAAALGTQTAVVAGVTIPPNQGLCSGGNFLSCTMVGLAVAQMALSMIQSGGAKKSAAAMTSNNGFDTGSTGTSLTAADPSSGYQSTGANRSGAADPTIAALNAAGLGSLVSAYQSGKATAANAGVVVSADGQSVKLPNGKTVPSSSFGSAEGMKQAGFSNADIASTQNAMADAMKSVEAYKSKVASLTNDQGGGGGGSGGMGSGGGGGSGGDESGGDPLGRLGKHGGAGDKKDKGVAGMSKKLGSDSIGVSGDDIFEMVTRRYQARDKVNTFLKN